jgi:hypothetical protein
MFFPEWRAVLEDFIQYNDWIRTSHWLTRATYVPFLLSSNPEDYEPHFVRHSCTKLGNYLLTECRKFQTLPLGSRRYKGKGGSCHSHLELLVWKRGCGSLASAPFTFRRQWHL